MTLQTKENHTYAQPLFYKNINSEDWEVSFKLNICMLKNK